MRYKFYGSFAALLVVGAIVLAGCGSNASTPTPVATLDPVFQHMLDSSQREK